MNGVCYEKSAIDKKGRIIIPKDVLEFLGIGRYGEIAFDESIASIRVSVVPQNDAAGHKVDKKRRVVLPEWVRSFFIKRYYLQDVPPREVYFFEAFGKIYIKAV